MSLAFDDQRELFLPLIEGIHDDPPWRRFMENLVARTGARRAFMLIRLANTDFSQDPTVIDVAAPRAAHERPLDFRQISGLGLYAHINLLPLRVYSLEDLLTFHDPDSLRRTRTALARMGIGYGRWLRVTAPGEADAWLVLVRERDDFSAAAVRALAGIGPHLTCALRILVELVAQRLQVAMAQSALARLGVGQLAFDRLGRVIAADDLSERLLAFAPDPTLAKGRRLQLEPAKARVLEETCAAIADGKIAHDAVLLDRQQARWLLLRRAHHTLQRPHAAPAVMGVLRLARREDPDAAIAALSRVHGLSKREAELAHALTMGSSIVEAAEDVGLTSETARHYTKRVYAKTATRGQADLVRLLLTGIAPLC